MIIMIISIKLTKILSYISRHITQHFSARSAQCSPSGHLTPTPPPHPHPLALLSRHSHRKCAVQKLIINIITLKNKHITYLKDTGLSVLKRSWRRLIIQLPLLLLLQCWCTSTEALRTSSSTFTQLLSSAVSLLQMLLYGRRNPTDYQGLGAQDVYLDRLSHSSGALKVWGRTDYT